MGLGFRDIVGLTALHNSLLQQQDQHAKMQQEQQDQQTRSTMQDIMNRLTLQSSGRPVTAGTVQDQMNLPDSTVGANPGAPPPDTSNVPPYLRPNAAPPTAEDLQNLPTRGVNVPGQAVSIVRKPDASRLVKYKDLQGNESQYELYTPEEQIQRQTQLGGQQALAEALAKAKVGFEARRQTLGMPGASTAIPDAIADTLGYPRGTRALITELPGLKEQADAVIQKRRVKLSPGETETELPDPLAPPSTDNNPFATPGSLPAGQTPGQPPQGQTAQGQPAPPATPPQPGGGRVLATGGDRLPEGEFERDFLPAYAMKKGKTPKTLSADERIQAFGQFTEAKADPQMRAIALALKQAQENQQPTKDDAQSIADMIHNHQMAPSQLSLVGGFGPAGQALKRMVLTNLAGRGDNLQEMEGEYQLAKSPGFQQNIRYMDQVTNSLPRLMNAANQLGNTSMKAINSLVNAGKNQFNNVDLKAFTTDVTFVADEVGKILQGGGSGSGTSDAKLRQAQQVFSTSDSPAAIATAAKEVQYLIGTRRQALTRGTYMEQPGGGEQSGALPKGAGKAADAGIIKQFLDASGGDKDKARAALKTNGWTIPGK